MYRGDENEEFLKTSAALCSSYSVFICVLLPSDLLYYAYPCREGVFCDR